MFTISSLLELCCICCCACEAIKNFRVLGLNKSLESTMGRWHKVNMRFSGFKAYNLLKYRGCETYSLNHRIILKFDRRIGSTAADVHVRFRSGRTILNANLAGWRLCEVLQQDVLSYILKQGP